MSAHSNVLRRTLAVLLACCGLAAVLVARPMPAAALTAPTTTQLTSYESYVVKYVNAQRAYHGLRPLVIRSCPDYYAERWASRLRTSSTIYHQSLTPILTACQKHRASENIARGFVTPSGTVRLWMGSSGHRANILDPRVYQLGIGTTWSSSYGYTTVVDFLG